jgi:hypothetical protein
MQRDGKYGVAVRISNPENTDHHQTHERSQMEHFVTLPRNGKNRKDPNHKGGITRGSTPSQVKARSGATTNAGSYSQVIPTVNLTPIARDTLTRTRSE